MIYYCYYENVIPTEDALNCATDEEARAVNVRSFFGAESSIKPRDSTALIRMNRIRFVGMTLRRTVLQSVAECI